MADQEGYSSEGCGQCSEIEPMRAEIGRLRIRNAALVEIVRDSLCPYDGLATGVTVANCQQCGCSHGLMIRPLNGQ